MDWSHGRWVLPHKHKSPNHEENIMEESSRRERDLSAQVRGQEVSAAKPMINDEKMDFLSLNSMVEVRSNKHGLKGAWFVGKILESYSKPKEKLWLQYQSITECVHISFIRPLPPPPSPDQIYKLHDIVDAFHRNGWWKGIVSKVGVLEDNSSNCTRYTVVLDNPYQELDFSSRDLRFHLVWNDGKWDRLPNQEIPITEDCEKQSADVDNTCSYNSKVVPETEESPSKLAKKLRKENSVISLTPSVLMKSTEQATLTKYLTRDLGANLPLDKGNNTTSPNEHIVGPDNRMEESDVSLKDSSKVEKEQSSAVEKSRKNLLEHETFIPSSPPDKCLILDDNKSGDAQITAEEDTKNEIFYQSSTVVDGQADSKKPPFRKSSYMWKHIDSLEIFRMLPQKPHFNYLSDCNEEIREGSAIGHMLTFASLVEKVTKLQIEDPTSLFDRYLEALAILEEIGFDVKAVADRVKELLILKTRQEQLDNKLKGYQRSLAECDGRKVKLEQEIAAIDKMRMRMTGLEEQRAFKVSQMAKEASNRDCLQLEVSSLKNAIFNVEHKFMVKSSCPWHTSI